MLAHLNEKLAHLKEKRRRAVGGATAEMLGRGGKTAVVAAGMSPNTVTKAHGEIEAGIESSDRRRAPGGGDKPAIDKQRGLLEALDELVHPDTGGNPMSLLRWTSKSSANLAEDHVAKGYQVSSRTVLRLLHQLGYSLQANAKVTEAANRDMFALSSARSPHSAGHKHPCNPSLNRPQVGVSKWDRQ